MYTFDQSNDSPYTLTILYKTRQVHTGKKFTVIVTFMPGHNIGAGQHRL